MTERTSHRLVLIGVGPGDPDREEQVLALLGEPGALQLDLLQHQAHNSDRFLPLQHREDRDLHSIKPLFV